MSGIDVVVATDDIRIVQIVRTLGGKTIMIAAGHLLGVDRLEKVVQTVHADIHVSTLGGKPCCGPPISNSGFEACLQIQTFDGHS